MCLRRKALEWRSGQHSSPQSNCFSKMDGYTVMENFFPLEFFFIYPAHFCTWSFCCCWLLPLNQFELPCWQSWAHSNNWFSIFHWAGLDWKKWEWVGVAILPKLLNEGQERNSNSLPLSQMHRIIITVTIIRSQKASYNRSQPHLILSIWFLWILLYEPPLVHGYMSILVVVERFTKMAHFMPCKCLPYQRNSSTLFGSHGVHTGIRQGQSIYF